MYSKYLYIKYTSIDIINMYDIVRTYRSTEVALLIVNPVYRYCQTNSLVMSLSKSAYVRTYNHTYGLVV